MAELGILIEIGWFFAYWIALAIGSLLVICACALLSSVLVPKDKTKAPEAENKENRENREKATEVIARILILSCIAAVILKVAF